MYVCTYACVCVYVCMYKYVALSALFSSSRASEFIKKVREVMPWSVLTASGMSTQPGAEHIIWARSVRTPAISFPGNMFQGWFVIVLF